MKFPYLNAKSLALALFALGVLTACGGGGGSPGTSSTTSTSGTNTSGTNTGGNGTSTIPVEVPAGTRMTMSCVDGSTYQCSGENIIRMENGVALTSSGVQAYARSTSDLATPIADTTLATGFAPTSGGVAEVRLDKDANGMVSGPALLLNNLGISWNGRAERPQIVETFGTTQGRVQLDANGALTFGVLPIHTDTSFYNFATLGPAATQANYANNRYFPRADPSRCPDTMTPCPTVEGTGVVNLAGDWRTGGSRPDWAEATRLHSDGDLHAGTDAAGNPLPEGTGPGVPYPGSKG